MQAQTGTNKFSLNSAQSDPMTWDESLKYIENLESHKFSYEEWEIARDLNFTKDLDDLIENCDPRLKK
jgi:hypothetical protein